MKTLLMNLLLITAFTSSAFAVEKANFGAIRTAPKGDMEIPEVLKNLPLILDTKNLKIEKIKDGEVESFNLDEVYGPGSSGGGGICALGITSATTFILKNIRAIPFKNTRQRDQFIQSTKTVRILQGANLEVRGQSVNALNYPSAKSIVLDEKACEYLEAGGLVGYTFLLHEYVGVAGLDDTTYQISTAFAGNVKNVPGADLCNSDDCMKDWYKLKNLRTSLTQLENEISFWGQAYLYEQGQLPDGKFSLPKLQNEFLQGSFTRNPSMKIAKLKRLIKEKEEIAFAPDGDDEEGAAANWEAMQLRLMLARIYRAEIAKALVEAAGLPL